ncbi:hypothetical protein Pla163_14320 [Planctomycetes bacterium Pla163]|uniref:DUF1570 domain-containing protein n=1 Tax=Rohdeia mirabilis TaxID=2528008 RepID=A0A518CYR6_9BACT|nr:hypothetical protein Pla163_14320 [Planctomycetes bacterium Pla163]
MLRLLLLVALALSSIAPASAHARTGVGSNPAAAAVAIADQDDRDLVVLVSGEELRGRVARAFSTDEIVLVQGGKRRTIDRADVASTSTVAKRLAEWLELVGPGLTVEREWELVELATAARLDHMARLQAYRVLLTDPDHEAAHAFLDHSGKPGRWRWRLDGKLVSFEKFEKTILSRKSPLVLRTEHHEVRCDAGLRRAVETAFDLERLYATWMDEIGSRVDALEVLEPMIARVHGQHDDFRPLSSLGHPYYDPGHLLGSTNSYDNAFYTWFEPTGERPERLIDLAVQQLIYSTVLGDVLRTIQRDTSAYREAACLEVGLGDWYERRWEGAPAFGRAGAWRPDHAAAELARRRANSEPLASARHELTNLIHISWDRLVNVGRDNEVLWAKCRTFVAFLMENGAVLPSGGPADTKDAVLELLRSIYGVPTGNSSTNWDRVLAVVPIEELETAWKRWLALLP